MKKRLAAALTLAALLVLCGCGAYDSAYNTASSSNKMPSDSGAGYDETENILTGDMPEQGDGPVGMKADSQRKLIKNYSADIQTLEFEDALNKIEQLTAESGGYIEASSQSGSGAVDYGRIYPRRASYTLRIPAGEAENVMTALEQVGAITDIRRSSDDVTDYYYDIKAHLKSLRTQEKRLLELLEKADSAAKTALLIHPMLSSAEGEGEDGKTYGRLADSNVIGTIINKFDFFGFDYETYKADDLFKMPIDSVDQMTVLLNDSRYVIKLDRTTSTDSEGKETTVTDYTLNGDGEVSGDAIVSFFNTLRDIVPEGDAPVGPSSATPALEIAFKRNTAAFTDMTFRMWEYDSSFYLTEFNGETKLINKRDAEALIEAFMNAIAIE